MLVYLSLLGAMAAGTAYVATSDDDEIYGTEGNDAIDGSDGDDFVNAFAGDDLIAGGAGQDFLAGDDGSDSIDGGIGNDTIYGGDGDDVLTESSGLNEMRGGEGQDTITDSGGFDGTFGGPTFTGLYGEAGNDLLIRDGGQSAAQLFGGDGDDILVAGSTAFMEGGDGADIFITQAPEAGQSLSYISDFVSGEDVAVYQLADGEDPNDFALEEYTVGEEVVFRLVKEDESGSTTVLRFFNLESGAMSLDDIVFLDADQTQSVIDSQGADGPTLPDTDGPGDDDDDTGGPADGPINNLGNGVGVGDVTIAGTEFDDSIRGGLGNDEINGFVGDDFLVGDDGSDTIEGDAGTDTIYAGDGNDLLRTEGLTNEMFGNDGADILLAAGGAIMTGGDGGDVFIPGTDLSVVTDFNLAEDSIVVPLAEGSSAADYSVGSDPETGAAAIFYGSDIILRLDGVDPGTLPATAVAYVDATELETLLNSQGEDGFTLPETEPPAIPTEGDDALVGTDMADTIDGLSGNDTIDGAAGADLLVGGLGDDLIYAGDETAPGQIVDVPNSPLIEAEPGDTIEGGEGADTLTSGIGNVTMQGGDGDDLLLGGSDGVQILRGDAGDDTLIGGEAQTRTINVGNVVSPYSVASAMYGGDGADNLVSGVGYSASPFFSGFDGGGYFGGAGADTFFAMPNGDDMWIRDFNDIEDQIVLVVPDGSVVPEEAEIEYRVERVVVEPRYLIVRGALEITVRDTDGTALATAEMQWQAPRYSPDLERFVTLEESPFAEGAVVVMTESEAAASYGAATPAGSTDQSIVVG
ncbi:calcium-binding protein [Thalassococcus lentus]|uniref:Calcium-binding protein n=1 Tax=Thalassococcus lentus TaxID=1210524 RepID=A0ABT4XRA3_9RHOB|nr:calcium-binding protein [Thalassococcus lentus]MDA7424378.1 calcium-binding protein [Thalassococcus lentus]